MSEIFADALVDGAPKKSTSFGADGSFEAQIYLQSHMKPSSHLGPWKMCGNGIKLLLEVAVEKPLPVRRMMPCFWTHQILLIF